MLYLNNLFTGLFAILAKTVAIAIAILGRKCIAILTAIPISKSVLHYYCNNFCNTPLPAPPSKF